VVHLPTAANVLIGVTRQITFEAANTALYEPGAPDPVLVDLRLSGDVLEFDSDPFVFYDNFEGASSAPGAGAPPDPRRGSRRLRSSKAQKLKS